MNDQVPLSEVEVIEAEYDHRHGYDPPTDASRYEYELGDILNPGALLAHARSLAENSKPRSMKGLADSDKTVSPVDLPPVLLRELNSLVKDPSLLELPMFRHVQFSDAISRMPTSVEARDRYRLNRRALDEVFCDYVRSFEKSRWPKVLANLHAEKSSALCLSGGGIRSATFNLGVMQGFAKWKVLEEFDYLSTVSGGGYIGAWLSAWMHREGRDRVLEELENARTAQEQPEPDEIRYLRSYSSYLNPRYGLFSSDTWTLAATLLRNLLLNWLVILPVLLLIIMVPRLWSLAVHITAQKTLPGWIGSVATAFAGIGFFGIAISRPVGNKKADSGDAGKAKKRIFFFFVVAPFLLSAFLTSLVRAQGAVLDLKWKLIVVGAATVVSALAAAVYSVRYGRLNSSDRKWPKIVAEIFGAAFSGAAVAGFLLLISVHAFPAPLAQGSESLAGLFFIVFGPAAYLSLFFLQSAVFIGLTSFANEDMDREWWARAAAWFLILTAAWIAVASCVIFGPVFLYSFTKTFSITGALTGIVTLLVGRSDRTAANASSISNLARATDYVLAATTTIFVIVIVAALSLAITEIVIPLEKQFPNEQQVSKPAIDQTVGKTVVSKPKPAIQKRAPEASPDGKKAVTLTDILKNVASHRHYETMESNVPALWACLFLALLLLLALFCSNLTVNVNRFSLHAMYRDRLIRAYLGATRNREPETLTGFDPSDNLKLKALAEDPHEVAPAQGKAKNHLKPLHVINATMNLVKGKNLAWQQRKAESFTFSPLHCGTARIGYRPAATYGDRDGMSVGTAVAISGAAVSSNMGYHTSPAVAFLLTLFNARLGWWLANPGPAGQGNYNQSSPMFAAVPIFSEALGETTDDRRWVFLSDGGHFENLGLYEMVRRRCHRIVVVDAGCDPKCSFEDLGNAIRKIRIDLGIQIDLNPTMSPKNCCGDAKGACTKPHDYWTFGTIHYKEADEHKAANASDGCILYIKPSVYGTEPADVGNYSAGSEDFPHESTADQFFTEQQFESYRTLGEWIAGNLLDRHPTTLSDVFSKYSPVAMSATPISPKILRSFYTGYVEREI